MRFCLFCVCVREREGGKEGEGENIAQRERGREGEGDNNAHRGQK